MQYLHTHFLFCAIYPTPKGVGFSHVFVKVTPQYCAEFNITLDDERKTEHITFAKSDLPLEIGPNFAQKEKSETVFLKIINV